MNSRGALYSVWADGSYRDSTAKVGAGWLIRHDGFERDGFKSIDKLDRLDRPRGSDIAEMFAVSCSLREIPSGSTVHLHMDCKNILEWIVQRRLGSKTTPTLGRFFEEVMLGTEKLAHLDVSFHNGRNNAGINRVHILSRRASSPQSPRL